jgi:hypothetical protein
MKRLLQNLTPARVAIACIVFVVALGGTSYAALTRGSSSSSNDVAHSATSPNRSGAAASAVAVEQRLERSRHAVRPEPAKARAKARVHVKVRKAGHEQRVRPHPVAATASRVARPKPRSVKPVASSQPTRVRKARRADQARAAGKRCRRKPATPVAKRSDNPAPVRTCKSRPNQPPPPPPPPPPPQIGDDR